jgi:hypothetical protein
MKYLGAIVPHFGLAVNARTDKRGRQHLSGSPGARLAGDSLSSVEQLSSSRAFARPTGQPGGLHPTLKNEGEGL